VGAGAWTALGARLLLSLSALFSQPNSLSVAHRWCAEWCMEPHLTHPCLQTPQSSLPPAGRWQCQFGFAWTVWRQDAPEMPDCDASTQSELHTTSPGRHWHSGTGCPFLSAPSQANTSLGEPIPPWRRARANAA